MKNDSWLRNGAVFLGIALALSGCGGGGGHAGGSLTPPIVIPRTPASLAPSSGDAQSAPVGTLLASPLAVLVADAAGVPLAGVSVHFALTSGGGSLGPASASDGQGIARVSLQLGPGAGTTTVTASASGVTETVTFHETALAAPAPGPTPGPSPGPTPSAATTLTLVSGGSQSDPAGTTLPAPIVVLVTDALKNPVSGFSVGFAVTSGGGTVASATVVTDAAGLARTKFQLPATAGTSKIAASGTGLTPLSVSETATAPGTPSMTLTSGDAQKGVAGMALTNALVVSITSPTGTPVAGINVTFAVLAGKGSLSATTVPTDALGRAASTLTLGKTAGPNTVTANAAGVNGAPVTFSATGIAGAAADLVLASGNNQTAAAGTPLANPLGVTVLDANGNPVAGVSVAFSIGSGGGTLTASMVATDALGLAATRLTPGAGANTVLATKAGLAGSPVTFAATGTPVVVKKLSYVTDIQPILAASCTHCHVSGGQAQFAPLDTYLALTSGKSAAYAPSRYVTPSSPAGSLVLARINGVATIGGVQAGGLMPTPGSGYTITPADVQKITTWISQGAVQSLAAPPAVLLVVSGNAQTANAGALLGAPFVVLVTDASGSPVPGVTVTFAVATGGGSLTALTAATDSLGHAATSLTLGTSAGANTVTASVPGLTGLTFTATARTSSYSGEPLASSTNPIDVAALRALKALQIEPSPLSGDSEFLRRVTSDVAGRLPTEAETLAFLGNTAATKRAATIDTLLASSDYAAHWANLLSTWACITTSATATGSWISTVEAELASDTPVSTIVHNLCTGSGVEGQIFDSIYTGYGNTARADQLMLAFTGMSSECARCHDHKLTVPGQDNPMWTQEDNFGIYAFFANRPSDATKYTTSGGRTGNPVQPHWVGDGYQAVITPAFTGSAFSNPNTEFSAATDAVRRKAFADIFVASHVFARGTAHRILADVLDPLLAPNQFLQANLSAMAQPEVLAAITTEFQKAGFSLRRYLRVILTSRVYQLTRQGTTTANDAYLARRTVRRQHGEVLERATSSVCGVPFVASAFLETTFGFPADRRSILERNDAVNLGQAFVLMNSPEATNGLAAMTGSQILSLAAQVDARTITLAQAITTIFRNALSRDPTAVEIAGVQSAVAGAASTRDALEDVVVGVCTSSEFVGR